MEKLLSLIIFLPLVTTGVISLIRKEEVAKIASVAVSGLVLILSLILFFNFDFSKPGFQFETKIDWIPALGISYHLGLDGMSISLIVMTALLFFAVFVWSWRVAASAAKRAVSPPITATTFSVWGADSKRG